MYITNIVFSDILNNFNFSYIFSIVILTYIIIKFIDYINKDKKVSTWSKRIVLTISIIFITAAYIFSGYKDYITLLNSAIFSPVFYFISARNSWICLSIIVFMSCPACHSFVHSTVFSTAVRTSQAGFQPKTLFIREQSSFRKFAS